MWVYAGVHTTAHFSSLNYISKQYVVVFCFHVSSKHVEGTEWNTEIGKLSSIRVSIERTSTHPTSEVSLYAFGGIEMCKCYYYLLTHANSIDGQCRKLQTIRTVKGVTVMPQNAACSIYLFIYSFNITWQKQPASLTCHNSEHKITVYMLAHSKGRKERTRDYFDATASNWNTSAHSRPLPRSFV